jgi:hypothetical protein
VQLVRYVERRQADRLLSEIGRRRDRTACACLRCYVREGGRNVGVVTDGREREVPRAFLAILGDAGERAVRGSACTKWNSGEVNRRKKRMREPHTIAYKLDDSRPLCGCKVALSTCWRSDRLHERRQRRASEPGGEPEGRTG